VAGVETEGAEIDRREGGRWTLAQRVKNDCLWLLCSLAIATLGRLPPRALRRVGIAVGVLAHAIVPSARRLARRNVALVLPELDERARNALVASSYRELGGYLGEAVAMLDPRHELCPLPFAEGARETLDAAIAEGHGVLFASAHLGPWERVAGTLIACGIPFTAVAREAYDPRMTRLYDRLRGGRGLPTIYRGAPNAASRLLRALRRGEVLGIPMDLASRVPSIEVPFLGHPARTARGPARLALRAGAAVVVGVPTSVDGRAKELVLAVTRIATDDLDASDDAERALTTRINDVLSARIRELPASWVWMHPRWGTSITTV
jgi:KDO2-lipid IV(A) lauroyltransferase